MDNIQPFIEGIGERVEDILREADNSDFKGVGHTFKGSRDYQRAWEFAGRTNDEDYDVLLLVRVRRDNNVRGG